MFLCSRLRIPFLAAIVALSGTCVYLKTLSASEMRFSASSSARLKVEKGIEPVTANASADLTSNNLSTRNLASKTVIAECDDWRKPGQFDEAWEQVSFRTACASHDRCYHTSGASWSACNIRYQKELRAACDEVFASEKSTSDNNSDSSADASTAPSLAVCYDVADQYFSRVQRPVALRKFQNAQASTEVAAEDIDSQSSNAKSHSPADKMQKPLTGSTVTLVKGLGE